MIIEHLLKKSDFKRYVKSIKIPDHKLKQPATPIDWKEDNYLVDCVVKARRLGYFCLDNAYARTEKKKLVFRALSFLCRHNCSCDDVFDELYSKNNPDFRQKVFEIKNKYKKEIVERQQYIWALNEIFNQRVKLGRLFDYLEEYAQSPNNSLYNNDFSLVLYAVDFLKKTEHLKGKSRTPEYSYFNFILDLRNKYLTVLDNRLDETVIMYLWLERKYLSLSNTNLKILGDLLCDFYKDLYKAEIEMHTKERKNDYNRKRHKPKKKLSAQEKWRKIKELKSSGYTQKESASILEVSRSTVERNWDK